MEKPPRAKSSKPNNTKPLTVDVEEERRRLPAAPRPPPPVHLAAADRAASSRPTEKSPAVYVESTVTKPVNVEGIFEDFSSRRAALVLALTTDQEEFYRSCDPGKELVCLYGHADGKWEVTLPEEMVPPELPEPALGINFRRDDMDRVDWLSLIAIHSDSWLISVAFFFALYLNASQRMCLFDMMNNLPTVYETFADSEKYDRTCLAKDVPRSPDLMENVFNPKNNPRKLAEVNDEEDEVSDQSFCAVCGDRYHANGFWICCDICDRWFHGKCVKITAAEAELIEHYKCPDCTREDTGE